MPMDPQIHTMLKPWSTTMTGDVTNSVSSKKGTAP